MSAAAHQPLPLPADTAFPAADDAETCRIEDASNSSKLEHCSSRQKSKEDDLERLDQRQSAPTESEFVPIAQGERKPLFLKLRSSIYFLGFTVFLGLFTDMAVYGIIVPIVPFHLRDIGYSNVAAGTGWLVAMFSLGPLILSAPAGPLGERVRFRRTPLTACAVLLIGGLLMFMFADKFFLLVLARLIQGIAGIGIWVFGPGLLSDSTEPENIGKVMGLSLTGFSVGIVAGPVMGGTIYDAAGYKAPFYLALGLCVVDALCRASIMEHRVAFKWIVPVGRYPSSAQESFALKPNPSFATSVRGMLRCLQSPRILTVGIMAFAKGFMFGGMLDSSMTLYLNKRYGLDSGGAGLVLIAAVAPAFVASPLGGWGVDKFGAKKVCITTAAFTVPTTILLVIPQLPLAGFIVCLAVSGCFASAFLVPGFTEMDEAGKSIPDASKTSTFALFNVFFNLGCFCGPIIAGQVLDAVGVERGWQIVIGLVCALFVFTIPGIWLYIGGYKGSVPKRPED